MGKAIISLFLVLILVGSFYYWRFSRIPGVTVTSWWRWPFHNAEVGGQAFSLHQIGLAWDLVPGDAVTQAEVIKTGLPARLVPEGDHLHVQFI
jgi:hypothetical protein